MNPSVLNIRLLELEARVEHEKEKSAQETIEDIRKIKEDHILFKVRPTSPGVQLKPVLIHGCSSDEWRCIVQFYDPKTFSPVYRVGKFVGRIYGIQDVYEEVTWTEDDTVNHYQYLLGKEE